MAYFGRSPKKPGSVPGAASGGAEQDALARAHGITERVSRGRTERLVRAPKPGRAVRAQRKAR